MNFTLNPRHWFQKRSSDFAIAKAEISNRMRYNALYMLDPDVLVRHLAAFAAGDIAGIEHVIEEFENRDDKMKIGAFKMAAAVASKPWEIRISKGEEDNPRARLHQDVLTRFWNRIEVTDAFCRNRKGGVRLLVKQMMSAQSRVYAVHDLVWTVRGDGELKATFTQIPAWNFENRTGELRYLREPGAYTGEPMRAGEWLVTVGEGVGITAAILAMAKRLSWNDWLLFSEKCGMPIILGNTGAKENTPAWNALLSAIAAIAPKTGILTDLNSKMQAVPIGGSSGQTTYKDLVETVDRAISSLYRGGDLATMSSVNGKGTGSDAQDGESELMDGDGCAMVSETLNEQIDRYVIRFTCGDFEPLAGIAINPPAETSDIDREIKIDQHLGEFGVMLSKKDMLARYGRTEATDDDDAAERRMSGQELPSEPATSGLSLDQLASLIYPLKAAGYTIEKRQLEQATKLKLAEAADPNAQPAAPSLANEKISNTPAGQSEAAGQRQTGEDQGKVSEDVLKAFAQDTGPAADAIKEFLKAPSKEAADALLKDLPSLIPEDPALAAVIAEAMAAEFSPVPSAKAGGLSNEDQPEIFHIFNEDREENGRFAQKGSGDRTGGNPESNMERRIRTSQEALERYQSTQDHPSIEDITSGKVSIEDALKKGFEVKFGGQKLIFFTDVLGNHYDNPKRAEEDANRLLLVKKAIVDRNRLMPGRHYDNQIVLMSQKHLQPTEKKLVIIADAKTGVARSIMMAQQNYCDRNFKLWGRK